MSTHYLVDVNTTPILSSEINDVRTPIDGTSVVNGNFVVPLPTNVKLESDPTDLSDLLAKKYQGILANYPGFTNVIYDDLLDTTNITATATLQSKLGERGICGYNNGCQLTTSVTNVGATVSQVVLVAEFHRWRLVNPKNGIVQRVYEEVGPSFQPLLSVSTNGGTDFTLVPNGQLALIPLGQEGQDLQVRFNSFSFNPEGTDPADFLHVSSWALLY